MERKQTILKELNSLGHSKAINESIEITTRRQALIKELSEINLKQSKAAKKARSANVTVPELLRKLRMHKTPSRIEIDLELEGLTEDEWLCQNVEAMHRVSLLRKLRALITE